MIFGDILKYLQPLKQIEPKIENQYRKNIWVVGLIKTQKVPIVKRIYSPWKNGENVRKTDDSLVI